MKNSNRKNRLAMLIACVWSIAAFAQITPDHYHPGIEYPIVCKIAKYL